MVSVTIQMIFTLPVTAEVIIPQVTHTGELLLRVREE